jgi:hypothetical protein
MDLKSLFVMAGTAPQQAQADDAVAHDHDRGEDRVASERRLFCGSGHHDGDDQPHFDDRHGHGEDKGTERLAGPVGYYFGVMHGRKDSGDEDGSGRSVNKTAAADERRRKQDGPGQ